MADKTYQISVTIDDQKFQIRTFHTEITAHHSWTDSQLLLNVIQFLNRVGIDSDKISDPQVTELDA